MAHRHWHLVCYDVRDPARWRRVYRLLRGYGERVQYSVFRVRANDTQLARLRWELERLLEGEDDLLVITLCPRCADRISHRNPERAWPADDPPFRILGEPAEPGS